MMWAQAGDAWGRVRGSRLIKTASIYVSGYVLQKAVGFLLIPIWARFLLPEDYGITGTLLAYSGVLSTILALGLPGAAVRHYYDYTDVRRLKGYVTSVTLTQLAFSGATILALNAFGPVLWQRFTANTIPFDPYVRTMLWFTFADLAMQVPVSLYQAQQKAREFVTVQYGRFLLGILTSVLFVIALRMGAEGVLLSQLVSAAVVAVAVLVLAVRTWFSFQVHWYYVQRALVYGLPLVPHALASWMLQAADRLILERFVSLHEIGLYNFGYTIGMSMQFLVAGINQAWTPHYFRLVRDDPAAQPKIIRSTSGFVALIGGVCLVAVLFSAEVIYLLMPPSYEGATPYLPPVLTGYFLLGLYYFASTPLFYYRRTGVIPVLTGVSAALNVGANLWLVPTYGAIASAWITLATYGLLCVLTLLVSRRYQAYPYIRYGILVALVVAATVVAERLPVIAPGVSWRSALLSMGAKIAIIVIYAGVTWLLLGRQVRLTPKRSGND
jgi:O-antigen/teichoic acid export membrane protein